MFMWSWLQNIPISDPVERRLAPFLQLTLLAIAVAVGVALVDSLLRVGIEGIGISGFVVLILFVGALFVTLVLVRSGRFKTAASILITAFLLASVRRIVAGTVYHPSETMLSLFLPITIAGMFLNRPALLLTLFLNCVLAVIAVNGQQSQGNPALVFILNATLISVMLDVLGNTLRSELRTALDRNKELEKTRFELEKYSSELFTVNERLLITLRSIGDAVITTDAKGSVLLINDVAQRLTGWTQEDAAGQPLPDVFHIVNEETRLPVESPAEKVLREGRIVGLANHTVLIAKDGHESPIDDSGAPIRDANGQISGVVLVFRDITERKEAELQSREMMIAAERQKLARDLHDAVTQSLFSANIIAEALPRLWERKPEVALEQLAQLRQLTLGASAEMRALLLELRPESLVKTPMDTLLTQLCWALQARKEIETSIEVKGDQEPPLSEEVHVAFYRIAQECFNNIIQHGQAKKVRVRFVRTPTSATLVVVDNGIGFHHKTISRGPGLIFMHERAESINASLQIRSKVGIGTVAKLMWSNTLPT